MTFKEFINQSLLTFSTQKSYFSSKKIERFISFTLGVGMVFFYYLGRQFCWKCSSEIDVNDVLILSGLLFTYGGFNTFQIAKDKKTDNEVVEG
jgi:hypothetical protein